MSPLLLRLDRIRSGRLTKGHARRQVSCATKWLCLQSQQLLHRLSTAVIEGHLAGT